MGNVQCGAPTYDDATVGSLDELKQGVSTPSRLFCAAASSTTTSKRTGPVGDSFLKLHREDLEPKCILEPREVLKALSQQAEDLIRSEKLGTEDDVVSLLDEDDETGSRGESTWGAESAFAHSEFAPTEITTVSVATRQAGNVDKYADTKKSKSRQSPTRPPQMKGKEFQKGERVDDDVKNVITSATAGNSLMAAATDRLRSMDRSKDAFRRRNESVFSILPCVDDASQSPFAQRARDYMSALHLKMKPQCPQYYEQHVSVLDLESPTIQVGSEEMPVTPPRNKRSPGFGGPANANSGFGGLDFGEGPPSDPIQLMVSEASFMDLAVTGSLGLVNRPRSRPLMSSSPPRKQLKSPAHYVVLLNRRSGIPLVVCALKAGSTGPPVVRIYTTKPRVFGQRPAASTRKLGLDWSESLPLYTWAEIVTEGKAEKLKYAIFMASGSSGHFEDSPSYRAAHDVNGAPVIRMVGRTEKEKTLSGCAVISLTRDENAIDDAVFFHISVARGIDPALMICFTSLVDEVMEKAMRG